MPLSADLTRLRDDTLNFLRERWVLPGSGYTMHPGGPNPYLPLAAVFQGNVATTDSLLRLTNNRDKVGYATLVQGSPGKWNLDFRSHRQLLPGQDANFLPVWFLPWYSDHVTKMKILQRGMLPPDVPDADLFFTSALTGCSVFIEGPAHAPTVYHGGFSSVRDFTAQPRVNNPVTGVEADSITHWRLLFQQFAPGAANYAEVGKNQYFRADGPMNRDMQAYKRFLDQEHRKEMRIEDMTSEGMIFGMRDGGGDWTFYLQESVTVTIYTLRKKGTFKKKLVDGERQVLVRPMVLRKIYPTGGAAYATWNTTRLF